MNTHTGILMTLITAAGVFAAVWAGTGLLARVLTARGWLMDTPNGRSSHTRPTPGGAGVIVIPAILLGALALTAVTDKMSFAALLGHPIIIAFGGAALALTAVSLWDDWRGLHPGIRFAAQWAAVGAVAAAGGKSVFAPEVILLLAAAAVIWVWVINVFNFMDGVDGLAGVETAAIGAGLLLISFLDPGAAYPRVWGVLFTAAALGFLPWNWSPARIFLGDAGSIGLGFFMGWALMMTAFTGHPVPALILPMYFLADAGVTLLRRLFRGEKIWLAHREHFYQRAVQNGMSHAQVAGLVALLNIGLIGLACLAAVTPQPWIALILAAVMTGLFLRWLGRAP